MRLNRFLAAAGIGSRRSVESLIRAARVSVNGRVGQLHTRVDPRTDRVTVDGRRVSLPDRFQVVLFHKPPGCTVTRRDRKATQTVYDLLPQRFRHLAYVGRLDRDSEGLLLFTNDGELARRLLLPATGIEREYLVDTPDRVTKSALVQLRRGVELEVGLIGKAREADFKPRAAGGGRLRLILTEGKKREVRRMCCHLGIGVSRLRRIRFGPVRLGRLPRGAARELIGREIAALRREATEVKK
jgi:23S rRNA pseudouridine2605 synthase